MVPLTGLTPFRQQDPLCAKKSMYRAHAGHMGTSGSDGVLCLPHDRQPREAHCESAELSPTLALPGLPCPSTSASPAAPMAMAALISGHQQRPSDQALGYPSWEAWREQPKVRTYIRHVNGMPRRIDPSTDRATAAVMLGCSPDEVGYCPRCQGLTRRYGRNAQRVLWGRPSGARHRRTTRCCSGQVRLTVSDATGVAPSLDRATGLSG